jgi:predicted nuclease of predicted toxin-antitoxin system
VKLFIDDDLSPRLVDIGQRHGYDSSCVRDRAQLSRADNTVLAVCIDDDRTLVTANADDSRGLIGEIEPHPGLIILPEANLENQQRLTDQAILGRAGCGGRETSWSTASSSSSSMVRARRTSCRAPVGCQN